MGNLKNTLLPGKNLWQNLDPLTYGLKTGDWSTSPTGANGPLAQLGGSTSSSGKAGGGKKGGTPATTPDYTQAALATANSGKFNQSTPFGSVNWSLRPGADPKNPQPGDYIQTTSLSPDQQSIFRQSNDNKVASGLAAHGVAEQLANGPQGVQDALYNKATQYYDQNFGNQQKALDSQLANQGISAGSEAYNNAYDQFNQNKNKAYETATNDAITGATAQQGQLTQQLATLLGTSNPTVPTSSGGQAGADLSSAAQQTAASQLANQNASAAQQAQQQQLLASLAAAAATAFSDRRLKSNIERVGTGFADLPVYEYDIFGKRERGYMAQEVALRVPSAVTMHSSGYLRVDYSQLNGRP